MGILEAVTRLRMWILLGALAAFAVPATAIAKAKVITIKPERRHKHRSKVGKGGSHKRHSRRHRLRG